MIPNMEEWLHNWVIIESYAFWKVLFNLLEGLFDIYLSVIKVQKVPSGNAVF